MTAKPSVGPALPGGDEAFAEAHRELLEDGSIQFDLPAYQPPPVPDWLRWLGEFFASEHPILRIAFWALVVVAVLLILYLLARRFWGFELPWRRRRRESDAEDWRPEEAPARQLLGEADVLAARGLFSEAAHLLLFRSIEDIDSRRPDLVRPALTSRDIAVLNAIPERPRGAFARIAMLVERSLFAQRPLGEVDWRDCRSAYEEFAFAEGWRG